MRWTRALLGALALLLLAPAAAVAAAPDARKVALVIGNGDYRHAVKLPNPVNDARLIGRTLRQAGFEVIEGVDVDRAEMSALIDRFTEKAYEAETALVYFAGHGIQVDGQNFIIPVDAALTSPAHLRTRTVQVDALLAALPPDPAVGVIILDACRDNPLARTLAASLPASRSSALGTGLAPVQANVQSTGTGGVLIAYATDPGAIALDGKDDNSPYTKALARHIATPGLEIQSALTRVRGEVAEATLGRQRPWHNASLGREVYIGGSAPTVAQDDAATDDAEASGEPARPSERRDWAVEQRLWDEASRRDTIAHYDLYLDQYPDGRFASLARLNRDLLAEKGETQVAAIDERPDPGSQMRTAMSAPDAVREIAGTEQSEGAIGLDRAGRIDLQLRLSALGLDTGGIDGVVGPRSRASIATWQEQNRIPSTGFLTPDQHAYLVLLTEPMMASVRAKYESDQAAARERQRQQAAERERQRQHAATREQARNERARRQAARQERQEQQRREEQARQAQQQQQQQQREAAGGALATGVVIGIMGCKLAKKC